MNTLTAKGLQYTIRPAGFKYYTLWIETLGTVATRATMHTIQQLLRTH